MSQVRAGTAGRLGTECSPSRLCLCVGGGGGGGGDSLLPEGDQGGDGDGGLYRKLPGDKTPPASDSGELLALGELGSAPSLSHAAAGGRLPRLQTSGRTPQRVRVGGVGGPPPLPLPWPEEGWRERLLMTLSQGQHQSSRSKGEVILIIFLDVQSALNITKSSHYSIYCFTTKKHLATGPLNDRQSRNTGVCWVGNQGLGTSSSYFESKFSDILKMRSQAQRRKDTCLRSHSKSVER